MSRANKYGLLMRNSTSLVFPEYVLKFDLSHIDCYCDSSNRRLLFFLFGISPTRRCQARIAVIYSRTACSSADLATSGS